MSSDPAGHALDFGTDFAATVLADLHAAQLPLTPRHFELWATYHRGTHPALAIEIDDLRVACGRITAADVDALYERHLSPWRHAGTSEALTERFAGELDTLATMLDGAIGATLAQRERFMAETCELSITGAMTLQRVIEAVGRLVHVTRDGRTHNTILQAQLSAANRQIEALRTQVAAVCREAETDPLTAVASRPAFDTALARALRDTDTAQAPLAMMLADIDYFGHFNDACGRTAGDQLLHTVGVLLRSQMRPDDTVARVGVDTFAVLMPATTTAEAVQRAERFRQGVMLGAAIASRRDGEPMPITMSFGVAPARAGDTIASLHRRAAEALRVAKAEGRNRVVEIAPDGRPVWTAARRA